MAYNQSDNSELRSLQLVILDIVRVFVDICERHQLRYYMVGGTMLGAIRHKGFIPWDDDMDVGMPRPDYEKFLTIVRTELPEGYSFLNYKQDADYLRYFSRIVDERVRVTNASGSEVIVENAWLDIFPLDGMPRTAIGRSLHFWHVTAWRFFYHASCFKQLVNLNRPGRPLYQRKLIRFIQLTHIGEGLDSRKLLRHIEKLLLKYPYDDSTYMVSLFGIYMTREIVEKRLLGAGKMYPFETLMLRGPSEADAFLTHFFGDYMTPPNDADKDKHNILSIEYEKKEA